MKDIIVYSACISVIYFLLKFIEMRFVLNDTKPVKILVRDSLMVCFSVISGSFIIQQVAPQIKEVVAGSPAMAFTGEPDF